MIKYSFAIIITISVFSCLHDPANTANTTNFELQAECLNNLEVLEIQLLYIGSVEKPAKNLFICHSSKSLNLNIDPFRMIERLETNQMKIFIIDFFQKSGSILKINKVDSFQNLHKDYSLNDYVVILKTSANYYIIQFNSSLTRKSLFEKILNLPNDSIHPTYSFFNSLTF